MFIKKIKLADYRNISDLSILFSEGVNVFVGDNAQGKTNIIESIWLFSSCKSFRTSNERDLIMNGKEICSVKGFYEKNGREFEAEIKFSRKHRREVILNGIKTKPKELLGQFAAVLFFPEHLSLVKSGPETRRKFLDLSISQIKPRYFDYLAEYNKVLSQRNFLLKEENPDLSLLDVYDGKLAHLNCIISKTRSTYTKKLEEKAQIFANEISDGKEKLSLIYNTEPEDFDESKMLAMLKESRDMDFRLGYTSCGAQKDDLLICINGFDAKFFASQGQQKSCVMSMKLAEAEILKELYGEYPLILLDDVFSELDMKRKNYITEKIKDKQVIVTTCDEDFNFDNAKVFRVFDGNAEEVTCI